MGQLQRHRSSVGRCGPMLLEFWTGSERVPSTFSQRILRRWQIVQVARDELPVSHCSQFGLLRATAVEGVGAAGVKTATLGRMDGVAPPAPIEM